MTRRRKNSSSKRKIAITPARSPYSVRRICPKCNKPFKKGLSHFHNTIKIGKFST